MCSAMQPRAHWQQAQMMRQRRIPPLPQLLTVLLATCSALLIHGPAAIDAQTARQRSTRTLRLGDVPGCGGQGQGTPYQLQPGLDGNCNIEGTLGPEEILKVTFDVPSDTAGTYSLMVQLRTVDGVAILDLSTPVGGSGAAFSGRPLYATMTTSEEFIALEPQYFKDHPGAYTISLTPLPGVGRTIFFNLQVMTPLATTRLVPEEVAVMRELLNRCCASGKGDGGDFCTKFLPAAIAPNHPVEDDLCRLAPITCTPTGRLRQLVIPNAGLDCGKRGLPESFFQLSALESLDLAYNDVGGTAEALGGTVSKLLSLRRLFMRYTGLSGSLPCSLISGPALTLLSVSGNMDLTGTLPGCFMESKSLQELYVSTTSLTGPLPDTVPPEGSNLRVLFINGVQGDVSQGLEGPIPPTIAFATNLTFLSLPNNKFEGPMPMLPRSLKLVNVSSNRLTALPPTLPNLEVLDASHNALAGALPPVSRTLRELHVGGNQLTGAMPQFMTVEQSAAAGRRRRARRATARRLAQDGASSPSPDDEDDDPWDSASPQLRQAVLSGNKLSGGLPQEWVTLPRRLVTLDVGNNQLGPELPDAWDLPRLAVLNLGDNVFQGTLPASIGSLPSLIVFDAHANTMDGDLAPFAAALAKGSPALVHLNLAANQFDGAIPDQFSAASVINSNNVTVELTGSPAPRVFDLSNNTFGGGVFPLWLLEAAPREADKCKCRLFVAVNGIDADLSCPTASEAAPYVKGLGEPQRALLDLFNLTCTNGNNGEEVPVLSVLNGSAAGPRTNIKAAGNGGNAAEAVRRPGVIAGIVVGAVVLLALLALSLFLFTRKARLQRQGWSQQSLDGGPSAKATQGWSLSKVSNLIKGSGTLPAVRTNGTAASSTSAGTIIGGGTGSRSAATAAASTSAAAVAPKPRRLLGGGFGQREEQEPPGTTPAAAGGSSTSAAPGASGRWGSEGAGPSTSRPAVGGGFGRAHVGQG